MRRKKKLIAIAILAATMLIGSISGIALAADNGDDSEPEAKYETLLNRTSKIYQEKTGVAIDQEVLKDAFAQAQSEMQTEAVGNYLQSLVEQDKMTQEEADGYLEWWQARPDVTAGFSFGGRGGFRGMGGPRGMRGFGWPCTPTE